MSIKKQQEKLDYHFVFCELRRQKLTQQYFVNLFDVSASAVSQALRGKSGMGKLLSKINRHLVNRNMRLASKKLRSINNPYERKHTSYTRATQEINIQTNTDHSHQQ
jgi:predicted transcriptional regulator